MTASDSQKFETIRTWLNGKKSYHEGVMLLRVYHADQDRVRSLDSFQNEYLLNKMMEEIYEELKAKKAEIQVDPVARNQEIRETVVVDLKVTKSIPLEITVKPKSSELKKLEEIKKARTHLYKERAAFHVQMCDIAYTESGQEKGALTNEEIKRRHELAEMIIGHTVDIDRYWAYTDFFEVNGYFPFEKKEAAPALPAMTNAEALRKLMNIRSTISKTTKKIADAEVLLPHMAGKELEKLKKQMSDWSTKLKILEAEKLELENTTDEPKDN